MAPNRSATSFKKSAISLLLVASTLRSNIRFSSTPTASSNRRASSGTR